MPYLFALLLMTIAAALPAETLSPYAGQHQRPLKALSEQAISDLRSGAGMGLARPAELNHYPGPRHVLDLADELQLTLDQRAAIQALFERMQRSAMTVGADIIMLEQRLEDLFAQGRGTAGELKQLTARIAELNGELRFIHLNTHLEQRRLPSEIRIATDGRLRDYDQGDAAHPHAQHHAH